MSSIRHTDPASNLTLLERSLYFRQLQINRLLEVTQAINNNVSASDLYKIYKDILSWEMKIKKLMLWVRKDEGWVCAIHNGIDESLLVYDIRGEFDQIKRLTNLGQQTNPLMAEFDVALPVLHKEYPIAYAFLGGFSDDDDLYEKMRFISTITNIIAVAIENKRLFKQQLQQERFRSEMHLAAKVQTSLIPSELPITPHYELGSYYLPHEGIGGDYYDYIPFGETSFFFCMADISGKGVAAALLMANFQANLHALINADLDPDLFIQRLNSVVLKSTQGDKFITLFVGKYDTQTRQLRYINAGHNPPILYQGDNIAWLDKGCTILGTFKKIPKVEMGELIIPEQAFIVSYTDGLTELTNMDGEYFGENRLVEFTKANAQLSTKQYTERLIEAVNVFKGDNDFPDDISVLSLKIF